jgi:hypothetical protein
MPLNMSTALRTARAQAIIDAIDAGSTAGTIKFYTATKPSTGAAITTQTLLGTVLFQNVSGTATTGVLTFSATNNTPVLADGTISWARIADSTNAFVMDCDCGLSGSGATVIFNNLDVLVGGNFSILSAQITEGNV